MSGSARSIDENQRIGLLQNVTIGSLRLERFESVLAPERYEAVPAAAERARELLEGRVVWNVNSTARGGGVAEMLISLLAYARGAGVDCPLGGDWRERAVFFAVTKRVRNNLHSAQAMGAISVMPSARCTSRRWRRALSNSPS
jgi:trehalose synthase